MPKATTKLRGNNIPKPRDLFGTKKTEDCAIGKAREKKQLNEDISRTRGTSTIPPAQVEQLMKAAEDKDTLMTNPEENAVLISGMDSPTKFNNKQLLFVTLGKLFPKATDGFMLQHGDILVRFGSAEQAKEALNCEDLCNVFGLDTTTSVLRCQIERSTLSF